jgi:multicomponent Na+:H+ antiporter subunit F
MTTAEMIIAYAVWLALVVLCFSFLLTVWRVIKGPTLPDRVVALDMLTGIVIGFIALIAIRTGFSLYIDIAISLGLVGFLATVAFARFILARGGREGPSGDTAKAEMIRALAAPVPEPRRRARRKPLAGTGPAVRRKAKK